MVVRNRQSHRECVDGGGDALECQLRSGHRMVDDLSRLVAGEAFLYHIAADPRQHYESGPGYDLLQKHENAQQSVHQEPSDKREGCLAETKGACDQQAFSF